MLALAIVIHGGIALCLGMVTFGCVMLIANLAFLSPATTDKLVQRLRQGRAHPRKQAE